MHAAASGVVLGEEDERVFECGRHAPDVFRRNEPDEGLRHSTFQEIALFPGLLSPPDVQPRPEERDVIHLGHGGEAFARLGARIRLDLDERARVGREDLVACPGRGEPTLDEKREAGSVLGLVHVGRRDDDREPLVVEGVQDLPELAARHGVDARRRLVEEEEGRARQERRHERELLLHAARERAGEACAEAVEADASEEVPRTPFSFGGRHGVQAGAQREVLVEGEVLVQREALRHEAEGDVVAHGPAGRRAEEASDDAEEGRLAGAVGPDEREHLAARDREVDSVQRRAPAEAPDEPFGANHLTELVAGMFSTAFTRTSAGWPGTSGAFQPASRSTFAA